MGLEVKKGDLASLAINHADEEYQTTKKNNRTKIIIILIILIFVILLIVMKPFQRAIKVQVGAVINLSPTQSATVLNASGYVVAQRKAAIASKATGRLVYLAVEEGDIVKKNQILAKIESKDIQAQLQEAKANYNLALATLNQSKAELSEAEESYKRIKQLYEDQLVSQMDYDKAEARYKSANAALKAAEARIKAMEAVIQALEVSLESTYIRAPFDGTVLNKYADIGEMVAPFAAGSNAKASVLTIADMDSLQVEADVSEANIEKIKLGMPCEIIVDAYPEKSYHGRVHKIIPTADRSKATVLTKIKFLNKDSFVLPEMSAKVAFLSENFSFENDNQPKKAVFASAIISRNNHKIVFLVDDKNNKAKEVKVITGDILGDYVEIKEGLEVGNKVILNPSQNLKDGAKINISE
jgi:RND family efflux transporter MFP subunit